MHLLIPPPCFCQYPFWSYDVNNIFVLNSNPQFFCIIGENLPFSIPSKVAYQLFFYHRSIKYTIFFNTWFSLQTKHFACTINKMHIDVLFICKFKRHFFNENKENNTRAEKINWLGLIIVEKLSWISHINSNQRFHIIMYLYLNKSLPICTLLLFNIKKVFSIKKMLVHLVDQSVYCKSQQINVSVRLSSGFILI